MAQPKIIFWSKKFCMWCNGVRSFLKEHNLEFEEREVTGNPKHFEEMQEKSGQTCAPVLEIDGHLLVDVGKEEVAAYLKKKGFLKD